MEQIYTIPVNEAFDLAKEKALGEGAEKTPICPLCHLREVLNESELDRILGAAMMEPDVRIETNREGFCGTHFRAMLKRKNRLGLALILESHLDSVRDGVKKAPSDLLKGAGASAVSYLEKLDGSCYLCSRINAHFDRMVDTVFYLYHTDDAFKRKVASQHFFCLPHYKRMLSEGKQKLPKKIFPDFYKTLDNIERGYLDALREDVSWFCKKFDYRYENEPWYNAKDAIERTIGCLSGTEDAVL